MSTRSKDPSTKVGAVITATIGEVEQIVSTGYNGYCSGSIDITDETPREVKLKLTCHAEANAIALAARVGAKTYGGTIYIYGLPPCMACAKLIRQSGIKTVVYCTQIEREDWYDNDVFELFRQGQINVFKYAGSHNMDVHDLDAACTVCDKLASLRLAGIKAKIYSEGVVIANNSNTRKTMELNFKELVSGCQRQDLVDLYINHWITNYMEDFDE